MTPAPIVPVQPYRDLTARAPIVATTDGDTVHVAYLDQGGSTLDIGRRRRGYGIRLTGCNAWESGTVAGDAATKALDGLLGHPTPLRPVWVTLRAFTADPYVDRLDSLVILDDGTQLTAWAVANQYAAPWDGKAQPRPVPPWPRTIT